MSKAEDLSRQYVLPFLDKQYEKYGEYRQMGLSRFDGYDMMSAYEEGYQQAEKDVAESFARIIRGNLSMIDKSVQDMFEQLYTDITGEKMYKGFKD